MGIHETAVVEPGAVIGDGTQVWHFAHVRAGARIGENCIIGKDVYVDAGVEIAGGVKIQNGVSLYRGVHIEYGAFIGPNVTFTNDRYPRSQGEWTPVPTYIRLGASIGANATIICGIDIGPYAMIAAGAVVTTNVPPMALMQGNPARLSGYVCQCGSPMVCGGTGYKTGRNEISFACEKCADAGLPWLLRVEYKWGLAV